MKSTLKIVDSQSIIEVFREIDENSPFSISKTNNKMLVSINLRALLIDSETNKLIKQKELLEDILNAFNRERLEFLKLLNNNLSLFNFIKAYRNVYKPSCSKERLESYIEKTLGKDHTNACINVFLKEDEYRFKPVIYVISHRKDYEFDKAKRYSEDEVLRLIESKEILVRYSTNHIENGEHFFCAIEECLDLDNDKVVSFTMNNYPFIYENLRSTLDEKTISNDKRDFNNNRKQVLTDIMTYFRDTKYYQTGNLDNISELKKSL